MEQKKIYNCVFRNCLGESIVVQVNLDDSIEYLIHSYFMKKEKENLFIDNIEKTYFIFDGLKIDYKNKNDKVFTLFKSNEFPKIYVYRLDYKNKYADIKIIDTIKENIYSNVYKAEYEGNEVAVKKIKKDQLKEDLKESLCIDEINEDVFREEIIKFNRELENMKMCHCENSVEIYDYFDEEKEFVIVMELCDNNLFKELAKTKNGFNAKEIKEILLQLNNAFKKMNEAKIAHRDIKLHNILVKYLNKEKTKFKVLLSDYGVSNQLSSMTKKYKTHAGTQIIMAPEILSGKEYNNKCDLWSLGVNIFQLYTKKPPYIGAFDNEILNQIDKLGQSVLNVIEDAKLKDLLSKLLVKEPEKRISWEEYFNHDFKKKKTINIKSYEDINIIDKIKDNIYTCVYKAEYEDQLIALKREISNMQKCHCENSVEIYAYFDTEEAFIIAMELCDNTLFKELAKTKNGFSSKKIKEILLQLNNVFRKMNDNNIVHRDIKLNNILVKYLNEEKTKFKVLLSDYGVSNQLSSMTKNYNGT